MKVVGDWVKATLIPVMQELWDRMEPLREVIIKLAAAFASFMASAFVETLKLWLKGIIVLWDTMAASVRAVISAIQTLMGWIDAAIERLSALAAAMGSTSPVAPGRGIAPGLQMGMAYVPATMPAIIHRGEAVLTREQAERWRTGGGQTITINNYLGGVYGVDGMDEALDRALRDAGRYVR